MSHSSIQLKILSLNLWSTPAPNSVFLNAVSFLESQQVDLLLLQEANNGQNLSLEEKFRTVEVISDRFPQYQVHFAPTLTDRRQKEGSIENGQLLLSKFSFLNPQNIFFDIPYGTYDHDATTDFSQYPAHVQVADLIIGQKKVKVMNVHGPVWMDGLVDTKRRLRMKDVLLEQIEGEEYVILGGDFNVQSNTETISSIEKRLKSVFYNQLETSFNMKRKSNPGYASAVVDMIFVSDQIQILNRECPQVDVSDHLPLVVEVRI